jgi:hypothetical protein
MVFDTIGLVYAGLITLGGVFGYLKTGKGNFNGIKVIECLRLSNLVHRRHGLRFYCRICCNYWKFPVVGR